MYCGNIIGVEDSNTMILKIQTTRLQLKKQEEKIGETVYNYFTAYGQNRSFVLLVDLKGAKNGWINILRIQISGMLDSIIESSV